MAAALTKTLRPEGLSHATASSEALSYELL
jgi:hypothetical protein